MRESESAPAVSVFHRAYRRELDEAHTRATTALRSAGFRRLIDDILKSIIEQQVQASREGR